MLGLCILEVGGTNPPLRVNCSEEPICSPQSSLCFLSEELGGYQVLLLFLLGLYVYGDHTFSGRPSLLICLGSPPPTGNQCLKWSCIWLRLPSEQNIGCRRE